MNNHTRVWDKAENDGDAVKYPVCQRGRGGSNLAQGSGREHIQPIRDELVGRSDWQSDLTVGNTESERVFDWSEDSPNRRCRSLRLCPITGSGAAGGGTAAAAFGRSGCVQCECGSRREGRAVYFIIKSDFWLKLRVINNGGYISAPQRDARRLCPRSLCRFVAGTERIMGP